MYTDLIILSVSLVTLLTQAMVLFHMGSSTVAFLGSEHKDRGVQTTDAYTQTLTLFSK